MHAMDSKVRYAGRVYLTYSMCGAALGFLAMVMLLEHGGTVFLLGGSLVCPAGKENTLRAAYVLGFFGFGVKAAVFPGHKWLLRASVGSHAGDRPAPCGGGGEGGRVRRHPPDLVRLRTCPSSGLLGPIPGDGGGHLYHCVRFLPRRFDQALKAPSGLVHHQ